MMKSQETEQGVKIDSCTIIVDVGKFLETSKARLSANPKLNSSCQDRIDKYQNTIKEHGNHE